MPVFGVAIGAAIGALGADLSGYGIEDDFIRQVRTKVTEGTSGLFLKPSSRDARCKFTQEHDKAPLSYAKVPQGFIGRDSSSPAIPRASTTKLTVAAIGALPRSGTGAHSRTQIISNRSFA